MLKRKLGLMVLTATLVMSNPMSVYAGTALNVATQTAKQYGLSADSSGLNMNTKSTVLNSMKLAYKQKNIVNEYVNPLDVTELSGLKATDYAVLLADTGLEGYGYAFEKAETDMGINGLFLLSLCALESGWGSSYSSTVKHNCAGIMGTNGTRTFSSLEDCIIYTAELLKNKYVSEDGAYYKNGKSIFDINKCYCTQIDWAAKIIDIAQTQTVKLQEHNAAATNK